MSNTEPRFPDSTASIPGSIDGNGPQKSRKGCLLRGCGCLSVIAVLFIGAFFLYLLPLFQFMNESQVLASENPDLKQLIGEPVSFGQQSPAMIEGDSLVAKIPVTGNKGSGTIVVKAKYSIGFGMKIERESMKLEIDGKEIDLNPDAATPPIDDIDDGSGT